MKKNPVMCLARFFMVTANTAQGTTMKKEYCTAWAWLPLLCFGCGLGG